MLPGSAKHELLSATAVSLEALLFRLCDADVAEGSPRTPDPPLNKAISKALNYPRIAGA
jgi:hypothetical protein